MLSVTFHLQVHRLHDVCLNWKICIHLLKGGGERRRERPIRAVELKINAVTRIIDNEQTLSKLKPTHVCGILCFTYFLTRYINLIGRVQKINVIFVLDLYLLLRGLGEKFS